MLKTRNPLSTGFVNQEDLHLHPACLHSAVKWSEGEEPSPGDRFEAPIGARSEAPSSRLPSDTRQTYLTMRRALIDLPACADPLPAFIPSGPTRLMPFPLRLAGVLFTFQRPVIPQHDFPHTLFSALQLTPPDLAQQNLRPLRSHGTRCSPLIALHYGHLGVPCQEDGTRQKLRSQALREERCGFKSLL